MDLQIVMWLGGILIFLVFSLVAYSFHTALNHAKDADKLLTTKSEDHEKRLRVVEKDFAVLFETVTTMGTDVSDIKRAVTGENRDLTAIKLALEVLAAKKK